MGRELILETPLRADRWGQERGEEDSSSKMVLLYNASFGKAPLQLRFRQRSPTKRFSRRNRFSVKCGSSKTALAPPEKPLRRIPTKEGLSVLANGPSDHQTVLLGEKFRSDDTIHTIIRKNSSQTKLCTKLHSLSDRTIHVRGDIYRALVFVFYIK
jgi:hypothetical protein